MGFRLKTILGVACIEAILVCLLIWSSLAYLSKSNQDQLIKRAETTAQLFAAMCTTQVLTMDLATLKSQVELLSEDTSVVYVRVLSAKHGLLVDDGPAPDQARALPGHEHRPTEGMAEARAEIAEGGVVYGAVELGLADQDISLTLRQARFKAFMTGGLGMVLSALFSFALGTYLTRQLAALVHASHAIGTSNFGYRLPARGRDELSLVARAFNAMAGELQRANQTLEERILQRTEELDEANRRLRGEMVERARAHRDISQILHSISAILIGIDQHGLVFRWGKAAAKAFQIDAPQAEGRPLSALPIPWDWIEVRACLESSRATLQPVKAGNIWYERPDGADGFLALTASPVLDAEEGVSGFLLLGDDMTDLKTPGGPAVPHRAAGGHRPVGGGHCPRDQHPGPIRRQLHGIPEGIIRDPDPGRSPGPGQRQPSPRRGGTGRIPGTDRPGYGFRLSEGGGPANHRTSLQGIQRISTIVQAMKRFSHAGDSEKKYVDLAGAMDNTLVVATNEWKYTAEVVRDYDSNMPEILCYPAEINQVLINVLVNAAHAIGEKVRGTQAKGVITVRTRKAGSQAEISIEDTGVGIPETVGDKIFNLFFTTKEVGKGTGQGLSIAHDIVTKHGGTITYQSTPGQGTTFFIRLPLSD